MKESYQYVSEWTPRRAPLLVSWARAWVAAVGLFAGTATSLHAGVTASPSEASTTEKAIPTAAPATVQVVTPNGKGVAADLTANPNIEPRQFEFPSGDLLRDREILLTGTDADSLLGQSAFAGGPADARARWEQQQKWPAGAPVVAPRPVTIPFPTAAHLFIPGAVLALYAARKMSPRYRRRLRAS